MPDEYKQEIEEENPGFEYGIDYAQDEVAPFEGFALYYTLTDGKIHDIENVKYNTTIWEAYSFADTKQKIAYDNDPKNTKEIPISDIQGV